jgi:hypothetical protein
VHLAIEEVSTTHRFYFQLLHEASFYAPTLNIRTSLPSIRINNNNNNNNNNRTKELMIENVGKEISRKWIHLKELDGDGRITRNMILFPHFHRHHHHRHHYHHHHRHHHHHHLVYFVIFV